MSKEIWINVFDQMVEEYEIEHECSWEEAYASVGEMHDEIHERYSNTIADMIDAAKDRAKSEGRWPPRPLTSAKE